jgi:hypothetical protein
VLVITFIAARLRVEWNAFFRVLHGRGELADAVQCTQPTGVGVWRRLVMPERERAGLKGVLGELGF